MRGKAHTDTVRAEVMAALLAGQGVTEVAKRYDLDHSLVSRWRKTIPVDQLHEVARKKERDFGELLGDYLEANLRALTEQAEVASDATYLRQLPGSELATLHGVMADKAVRLLEAAQAANGGDEATA